MFSIKVFLRSPPVIPLRPTRGAHPTVWEPLLAAVPSGCLSFLHHQVWSQTPREGHFFWTLVMSFFRYQSSWRCPRVERRSSSKSRAFPDDSPAAESPPVDLPLPLGLSGERDHKILPSRGTVTHFQTEAEEHIIFQQCTTTWRRWPAELSCRSTPSPGCQVPPRQPTLMIHQLTGQLVDRLIQFK